MKAIISLITTALFLSAITQAANASDEQTPPDINESTRGTPSSYNNVQEKPEVTKQANNKQVDTGNRALETQNTGAKGYVHGLEIAHSENNVQYMEDGDRDGEIQKKPSAIDEVIELPKWKLGQW